MDTGNGTWGPHGVTIRDLSLQVLERARDLRILEVMGGWGFGDDEIKNTGDSSRPAVEEWMRVRTPLKDLVANAEREGGFQLGSEFADIPERFMQYALGCDTGAYEAANAELEEAKTVLASPYDSSLEDLRSVMGTGAWKGDAATEFQTTVISPLDDVIANQQRIIAELQVALDGHRRLAVAAQDGAVNIANLTLAALENAIGTKKAEANQPEMFAIIGTVLAVGGIFVPGTPIFGVALAILGALTSTGTTIQTLSAPKKPEKVDSIIGGATATSIIASTRLALSLLEMHIRTEDALLNVSLAQDLESIGEVLTNPEKAIHVRAARVALAGDVPAKDKFEHWS